MTVTPNSDHKVSCSGGLWGGTTAFMPPEHLSPSMFRVKDSIPTPEADVYAFGLVTFQVCELDLGCRPFLLTSPRSSQASSHPAVPVIRSWGGLWFKDCVQPNQRTPHPLGFPMCCGVSSSAAGMTT